MPHAYLFLVLAFTLAVATRGAAQEAPCRAPSNTYDLIQAGIFEAHGCTQSFCHGADQVAGLDLRAGTSYASLLGAAPSDDEAEDAQSSEPFKFVEPRQPEESLLWLSLAKKTLQRTDVTATPMPIGRLPISADELEGVRLWILAGAPQKGVVTGVAARINACPPPTPSEDESLPAACSANEANLLLPDLVAEPPDGVRVVYRNNHRIMTFSTTLANVGDGPLIVQAGSRPTGPGESLDAAQILQRADGSQCSRTAGALLYQVDGKQWSYGDLATFELRKDDPFNGEVVARRDKAYFCLLDTDPIRTADDLPHQYEAHCEDDIGRMGISVGYKDVYHRVHPGQWLDLDADPTTTVAPGTYYLVNVVDPQSTLLEANGGRQANLGYTQVDVRLAALGSSQTAATPTPSSSESPEAQPGTVHQPAAPHRPHAPGQVGSAPAPAEDPPAVEPARQPRVPHRPHQPSGPSSAAAEPTARPPRTVHAPQAPHRPSRQVSRPSHNQAAATPEPTPPRHVVHAPLAPGQPRP